MAGERPAVGRGVVGKWGGVGVCWILDFREERDGGGVSGCTAAGKEMGEMKKM
jgi:hypothetical protein